MFHFKGDGTFYSSCLLTEILGLLTSGIINLFSILDCCSIVLLYYYMCCRSEHNSPVVLRVLCVFEVNIPCCV